MLAILLAILLVLPPALRAQTESDFAMAEGVVRELYDLVTFEAGTTPDWDRVRSTFLDEAVVVLRTSPDATTVFTVDGFVQDFVQFIETSNVKETGFVERIACLRSMVFGDMAHILVRYEPSIPGSGDPPRQGVDSFQLIKKDGRWWIVSVTNEVPSADRPVPPELRGEC
jgi:hypothetical protein